MDPSGKRELFSAYVFDSEDFACSGLGVPGTNCIGGNAVSWFGDQQYNYSSPKSRDLLFMHRPL